MELRFDGQAVLVTGASSGIGAALARAFGRAGAQVAVHYHATGAGAEAVTRDIAAAGGVAFLARADLTDARETETLVEAVLTRFGRVDVLVNNAGDMFGRSLLHETPEDVYRAMVELNMTSVYRLCRLIVPVMLRRRQGNIVNLASISARRGGGGGSALYGASKAWISTLTRGLAKELATSGIRVNAIAPGIIQTRIHDQHTPPERLQMNVRQVPLGRIGTPEDCVGTALFLAHDDWSGYITGQVIDVNGGLLMP